MAAHRRRTTFALSVVTVSACHTPAVEPVHHPHHRATAPAERAPSYEPVNLAIPDPPRLPEVPPLGAPPSEGLLVDQLPSLATAGAHGTKLDAGAITAIASDPATGGTRVRFAIGDVELRRTTTLRLDGAPCALHAIGPDEAECWSPIAPDAIVAARVEVVVPTEVHDDPCHDPLAHGTCNPPPPGWKRAAPAPPPPPIEARIIGTAILSNGTQFTVGRGSSDGITLESTCAVGRLPCKIIRVDKRLTVVRVDMVIDDLHAHATVTLSISSASGTR